MKKMKCESCGAELEVNEKSKYAICGYCNSKFKIKDENTESKQAYIKFPVIYAAVGMIVVAIMAIIGFAAVGNFGKTSINEIRTTSNHINIEIPTINNELELPSNTESNDQKIVDKYEINAFNSKYELMSGTQSKFFTESLLDKIIVDNQKNESRKIVVEINDKSTDDVEEIRNIKHNLENRKYEVILNYDTDGYINKIKLQIM